MTEGLLVIKKNIAGASLHRVSSPTKTAKKKVWLMIIMLFSMIIGMTLFWSGFHDIDLSQHYFKDGTHTTSLESNGFGMVSTIDDMYMQGLDLIIAGFFVFFYGGLLFGILLRDGLKNGVKSI